MHPISITIIYLYLLCLTSSNPLSMTIPISKSATFHHSALNHELPDYTRVQTEKREWEEEEDLRGMEDERHIFIVLVKSPRSAHTYRVIEEHIRPLKIQQYIPDGHYLIYSKTEREELLRGIPGLLKLMVLPRYMKISKCLEEMVRLQEYNKIVKLNINTVKSDLTNIQILNILSPYDIKYISSEKLILELDTSKYSISKVLSDLSNKSFILLISNINKYELFNKYAHSATQTGGIGYQSSNTNNSGTPYWKVGLNGLNQVVGVGDTGIDTSLCFFFDPDHPVPFNTFTTKHRKLVSYYTGGDYSDKSGGHGTHVCGSIAGAVGVGGDSTTALYNGMAPGAKLSFYDIQDSGGNLLIPDDMYNNYFKPSYIEGGAKIFSSSWGAETFGYDDSCRQTDQFAYDFQDFLPVFAAGNYGSNGYRSITTPGSAKNTLTVASSKNLWQSFVEEGSSGFQFNIKSSPSIGPISIIGAAPNFSPTFKVLPYGSYKALFAIPNDACSAITNGADLEGNVVFVLRGSCVFSTKSINVGAVNPVAMILVDRSGAGVEMGKADDQPTAPMPCGCITGTDWSLFSNLFTSSYGGFIFLDLPIKSMPFNENIDILSDFSSRGPTADGRYKPDISSVGESVMSANALGGSGPNWCSYPSSVHSMMGTSMATPITSGTAAIVRQYFQEGYHISGFQNISAGISMSAPLLKAVLINSGHALNGVISTTSGSMDLPTTIPSVFYGFGRLQLDRSLPIENNFNLMIDDATGLNAINTGDQNLYCYKLLSPTKNFKVTLVWADPAAALPSSRNLINNLDLIVSIGSSSYVYFGNQANYSSSTLTSNDLDGGLKLRDYLNNVEQVEYVFPTDTQFPVYATVAVQGTSIPIGPQKYALAATGLFEVAPLEECPSSAILCPFDCSGNGNCVNGVCVCKSYFTGADCGISSQSILIVSDATTNNGEISSFSSPIVNGEVSSDGWAYYHIDITNLTTVVLNSKELVITLKIFGGDPDIYVKYNGFPTFTSYDIADIHCNTCHSPVTSHVLKIPDAKDGRYIIGIYGYCCDAISYSLSVSFASTNISSKSNYALLFGVGIPVVLFFILIVYLLYRYNNRNVYHQTDEVDRVEHSEHVNVPFNTGIALSTLPYKHFETVPLPQNFNSFIPPIPTIVVEEVNSHEYMSTNISSEGYAPVELVDN